MLSDKFQIAVPHYIVKLPSGEYVVDAYFMKEIFYPPRRALLIYPTTVASSSLASEGSVDVFLESNLSVRDIYDILRSTYQELQVRMHKDIKRILHKSKLSLLIPMPRSALGDIDSEVRSALIIFNKVFGGSKLRSEADLLNWSKVHLVIGVKKVKDDIIAVNAPHPIPKIYEWLYRVDQGFKDLLDKVFKRGII